MAYIPNAKPDPWNPLADKVDYERNISKELSESHIECNQTSNVYGSKEGPQEDTYQRKIW